MGLGALLGYSGRPAGAPGQASGSAGTGQAAPGGGVGAAGEKAPVPPGEGEPSSRGSQPAWEEPASWQDPQGYSHVLVLGLDAGQALTDVVLLVQVGSQEMNVLHIPRDLYVGSGYSTGKINQVYSAGGADALRAIIRRQVGLPVDYVVAVDLETVRDVVDAVGGVPVTLQQQLDYLPGKTLYPGPQLLDGERAEWLLRYRQGYATGDLGRIAAQQQFLGNFFGVVQQLGAGKVLQIALEYYNRIETDAGLAQGLSLLRRASQVPEGGLSFYTLPVTGGHNGSYSVVFTDRERLCQLLGEAFHCQRQPGQLALVQPGLGDGAAGGEDAPSGPAVVQPSLDEGQEGIVIQLEQ